MNDETMSIRLLASLASMEVRDAIYGGSESIEVSEKALDLLLSIIDSAIPSEPTCTDLSLRDRVNIFMALRQKLNTDKQYIETQIALLKVGIDGNDDLLEVMKRVIASSFFDFFNLNPRLVEAYVAKMN